MQSYVVEITYPFILGIIITIFALVIQVMRRTPRPLTGSVRGVAIISLTLVPLFTLGFTLDALSLAWWGEWGTLMRPFGEISESPKIVLTPAVGILGVIVAAFPVRSKRAKGSAQLTARGLGNELKSSWFTLPGVALALVLVTTLLAGLASEPDDDGRYRVYSMSFGSDYASTDIYGWHYSVPSLIMIAALITVAVIALHVLAHRPTDDDPLAKQQLHARMQIIIAIVAGALFMHLGAIWHGLGATAQLSFSGTETQGHVIRTDFRDLAIPLRVAGNLAIALGYSVFLIPLGRLLMPSRQSSLQRAGS